VDHKIQVKFDYGGIDIYLSMMNCIPQLNVPTIVTGDFNIDLLSKSGSESKLTKFMHYYGFRQLITEPTHRLFKFEKIWLRVTFIFIQKPLKSLSSKKKRAIIHER
jgi:hypothetical protein